MIETFSAQTPVVKLLVSFIVEIRCLLELLLYVELDALKGLEHNYTDSFFAYFVLSGVQEAQKIKSVLISQNDFKNSLG